MIGLEDRLRTVEGVASIRVELAEEGIDAIQVEVVPGADEAGVLEEIRQVLVAYGLRSRRPGWKLGSRRNSPAIVASVAGPDTVVDVTDNGLRASGEGRTGGDIEVIEEVGESPAATVDENLGAPRVKVLQGGKGLIITLSGHGRSVEASSDISPIGAAEAMAKVVSDFHGLERPDRVAVIMHELDGERIVTLLIRRGGDCVVEAGIASPMLHEALYTATLSALQRLGPAS